MPPAGPPDAARSAGTPAGELAALPSGKARRALLDLVTSRAGAVLGLDERDRVGADTVFRDLGFDSLTSIELRNRLSDSTGLALPVTLAFDHPTPQALADHLASRMLGGRDRPATSAVPVPETSEPIAVVGMACRFPGGVRTADDLWSLLREGGDAIEGFPADRGWERLLSGADAATVREGGFLYDGADFDASFFGISPREALAMDPQQRLLLEAAWETVEHARLDPHSLRGSATGVFVGAAPRGYGVAQTGGEALAGYALTGISGSAMSGRLSYVLGLQGPAVTVDTACSSSLVALHLAVQSLRLGESTLALAGGVTFMPGPDTFVEFSRQGGLAADGRCKAFAEAADGVGWGEGVGVLLLERLSDARRSGRRILGVVRGSAVNQDGASNGLTAPNGPSQERVIRQALVNAGVVASEVDAVEAHGTGTRLGDPIEAHALISTYGQEREAPLWLGSVKSNIGHAQAAAGVAGVIKMVQAMRHGVLPRTLHVDAPSSHVDWSSGAVELLTEEREWPETGRPRRAGVSSFGISGTNAHVILEAAPEPEAGPEPVDAVQSPLAPWTLSATSPAGVRAQAGRLLDWLEQRDTQRVEDVALSLATTRSHLTHRAVVLGADRAELLAGLRHLAEGTSAERVLISRNGGGDTAFMFPGQGSQWPGMGRELHERFPAFRAGFDEACDPLSDLLGCSLREVVFGVDGDGGGGLGETVFGQAGLFAVGVGAFRLLESWGVRPDVVMGHSVGEIAAAHVAGVLSLPDACALVAARGRLMQALPAGGLMIAVGAAESEVCELLAGHPGVDVAAVNGPAATVLSGPRDAVVGAGEACRLRGWRVRELRVDRAFHSRLMEPMLEEFAQVLAGLSFGEPQMAVVSNVSGGLAGEDLLTPEYWVRHVREPVRFGAGVASAIAAGVTSFVELGPGRALSAMVADVAAEAVESGSAGHPEAVWTLRSGESEAETVLTALARLHARGVHVDWPSVLDRRDTTTVDLPTYPFQRERYWPEPLPGGSRTAGTPADSWVYRIGWDELSHRPSPVGMDGNWLLVVPSAHADGDVAKAAAAAVSGRTITLAVERGRSDRETLASRLSATAGADRISGVLSLLTLDETAHPDEPDVPTGTAATVALLQAMDDAGLDARVWCLTSGAVSTGGTDPVENPVQAMVWGLGRVAALEHPDRWGGLIDLPAGPVVDLPGRIAAAVAGSATEPEVAVRPSGNLGRRLLPAGRGPEPGTGAEPHGTVLITGGAARWGGRWRGSTHARAPVTSCC
ncbi:type I polyketide synthase [Actinomadura madurae]|uniref:type I polyketide synthase n=2 Tax=Actinomadura madurae TaxID=1993 RepID=UPI0020D1FA08|nr:type I polyketide synthase [Actinomadura madurae]MCQ0003437.1 acyltransferase domain-containing protein [Actinomadura madurae]